MFTKKMFRNINANISATNSQIWKIIELLFWNSINVRSRFPQNTKQLGNYTFRRGFLVYQLANCWGLPGPHLLKHVAALCSGTRESARWMFFPSQYFPDTLGVPLSVSGSTQSRTRNFSNIAENVNGTYTMMNAGRDVSLSLSLFGFSKPKRFKRSFKT